MTKIILFISIIFLNLFAYPSLDPDVLNKNEEEYKQNNQDDKNHFFISIGINASYITMTNYLKEEYQTKGTDDQAGFGGEFLIGYRFLSYEAVTGLQKTFLDNAYITNYMLGANFYFNEQVYFGGILGESHLKWKKSPITNTVKENKEQVKKYYGFEMGLDNPLYNTLSFYTKYQILFLDHKTNINDQKGIINHNIQNNIGIGVKYGF